MAVRIGQDAAGAIVELGEQLYNGSLKLNEGTMDDFYRPTRTWEFDSKTIGSYVTEPSGVVRLMVLPSG